MLCTGTAACETHSCCAKSQPGHLAACAQLAGQAATEISLLTGLEVSPWPKLCHAGGTPMPHRLLTLYRSAEPAMRVAKAALTPASPLMKRRTSSRNLPFHSPQTSQLGKPPTW